MILAVGNSGDICINISDEVNQFNICTWSGRCWWGCLMISEGLFGGSKNVGFDHILIVLAGKVVLVDFARSNIDYDITNW